MNVNKININQSEQTYNIASDIYDVTSNNNDTTFESLSALLSDENLFTLIPSTVRCGGMTIRFVQSSDNKYAQYRLMTTSFSTTESDWEDAAIIGTDRIADRAVTADKINFQQVTYPADGMLYTKNGNWIQYLDKTSMSYGTAKGTLILRGYNEDICTLRGKFYTNIELYYNIILFDSKFNEVGAYNTVSEEFSEYFTVVGSLNDLVLDWEYILTLNENARFVGVTLQYGSVKISSKNNNQWATSISIYDKKIAHITERLIKDGAVTTTKIADKSITVDKLNDETLETLGAHKYWPLPVFNNSLIFRKDGSIIYFTSNNSYSIVNGLTAIKVIKTPGITICDMYYTIWSGNLTGSYNAFMLLDNNYNIITTISVLDELFEGRIIDIDTGEPITSDTFAGYVKVSVPLAEIIEKYPNAYILASLVTSKPNNMRKNYLICEHNLSLTVDLAYVLENLPMPYKITTNKIADKSITADKIADDVIKTLSSGSLASSTWYCCGDSFSEGDFNNSLTPDTSYKFQDGKYKGLNKVYSRFIAIRNNMDLQLLAKCGATLGLRKDSINWGSDDFDAFNDIPYSPSKVTFNSSTITSVVLKTPSDENAGCCGFMSQGDNIFTYNSSLGWVYNSEQSATDISKFLTVTGSPNTGDTITVTMTTANNGFYNQFRKIEADKTEDEQRKFNGYITSWFGINDSGRCKLGTITDETLDTFYGSLNWWAINIIQKFPLAHIGFIVTNKCNSTFKQAIRDVAQKWAIPYLDMDGDIKIPSVSGTRDSVALQNIQVDPRLATYRWNNTFTVSPSNGHPNEFAHEWQSTFIENWLRTL